MLKTKLVVGLVVLGLVGCSEQEAESKAQETQVVAIVNGEELTVHQVNDVLRKSKISADVDRKDAANEILDKLIEQTVVYQAAIEQGLSRDPDVVSAIELAKVNVLNKAYLSKRIQKDIKIPESDVQQYFDDNAYLFGERRLFNYALLRIKATPEKQEEFINKIKLLNDFGAFKRFLDVEGAVYSESTELVSSEKMNEQLLGPMYALKSNDIGFLALSDGLLVIHLNVVVEQPVPFAKAKPMINAFLQNQKQQELLKGIVEHLKSQAEVEYIGEYSAPKDALESKNKLIVADEDK